MDDVDGWKSYTAIQHIEYDLESGVMSLVKFNTTIDFWNGDIKVKYEETVLEEPEIITSSDSADSNIELRWFTVPFIVFVIQMRNRR